MVSSEKLGRRKEEGHILLMGMKHCGKSTTGRLLGEESRRPFTDLDDITESIHDPARTYSCRQIFSIYGEEYFRRCEAAAASLIPVPFCAGQRMVIALGGGTPENEKAMGVLESLGFFVYLVEEPEVLYKRKESSGLPPFLGTEDPKGAFLSLYERRDLIYRARADLLFPVLGRNAGETSRALKEVLYSKNILREQIHGR